MRRIIVILIIAVLAISVFAQDDTTNQPPAVVTEVVTELNDPPRSNALLTYEEALGVVSDIEPQPVQPPQWASEDTFALVSVGIANLRNIPSIEEESIVVDTAVYGERFQIVGVFYPGESTVREPETEDFVFDDPNEREIWYLLDINGGAAWIFGGIVLVANPETLDAFLERTLTAEQQAYIDAQLALFGNTINVRVTSRLRRGPGTEFSQITTVPFNSRVSIIGRNEFSTWFLIDYNGTQGWVNYALLGLPQGFDATAVPIIR